MSQFSSHEAVSLEKTVDSVAISTSFELIDSVYEIEQCVEWIVSGNYQTVCLQFPDHLLGDAPEVAKRLQKKLGRPVYILADTAYESCCIDYVAAGHIKADGIIHFGPVCFSPTSGNIPFLNVYEKKIIDFEHFRECFKDLGNLNNLIILLDSPYVHLLEQFQADFPGISVKTVHSPNLELGNSTVVLIIDNKHERKLLNLKFNFGPQKLLNYTETGICEYIPDPKTLRRRYFLIEKIKDSQTLGIVIGTLGVKNYLNVIERLKTLANLNRKKYYIISVGKPTVAKLANFPEIDVFVIVTCSLNEIYDSRDYYKPLVTPYDVEVALNPASLNLNFTLDFNNFVDNPISECANEESDVSLITGCVRGVASDFLANGVLVAKTTGTVALNSAHGAGFLANRSWHGLEQNLGRDDVKLVEQGRKGIAQHYSEEMSEVSSS